MANPPTMQVFARKLDPSARRDYYPVLVQNATVDAMLQPGETVTGFTVALRAEAAAAGLRLLTGGKEPRYENLVFAFWVEIDPAKRGDVIFNGFGVDLGVEITFTTNLDRVDQFTVGVRVVNL